jgi:uncharacterized surface protein with fasciclin (FAS1) repeats
MELIPNLLNGLRIDKDHSDRSEDMFSHNILKKPSLSLILVLAFALAATSVVSAGPPERTSIVDVVLDINANTGDFSSLLTALTRVDTELDAGLIPLLDGMRQFTVFAPNDAAFDATAVALLGAGSTGADLVNTLPVEELLAILAYHVAPGNRDSSDVLSSNRVRTVSKSFVFPYVSMGNAYLVDVDTPAYGSPDALIVTPDVFADNGVIHVIDWVLIP